MDISPNIYVNDLNLSLCIPKDYPDETLSQMLLYIMLFIGASQNCLEWGTEGQTVTSF